MAEYRFPVPGTIIMRIIQNTPKPFPREVAMLSLMVDMDGDGPKSKRAYARIWGWSRHKVRWHFDDMVEEVESWSFDRINTGINNRHPTATQPPPNRQKKTPKSNKQEPQPPDNRQTTATQPPTTTHTHTQTNTSNTTVDPSSKEVNVTTLSPLEEGAKSQKWNAFDMSMTVGLETVLLERGNIDNPLTDAQREKWADEFRKLRELDGKSEQVIRAVLTWLVSVDDFWIDSGNFCSALKLRRKDKDGQTYFKRFELAARRSTAGNGRDSIDTIEAAVARQMASGRR